MWLSIPESEVTEACVTRQAIALNVRAVIAFKGAATWKHRQRRTTFLSDQSQMAVLVGRIFAGHLRSIVGSMTLEEIVTEQQKWPRVCWTDRRSRWPRSG